MRRAPDDPMVAVRHELRRAFRELSEIVDDATPVEGGRWDEIDAALDEALRARDAAAARRWTRAMVAHGVAVFGTSQREVDGV